jgi:outer membrane protein assembly factor BamD (BamD/ComL family)
MQNRHRRLMMLALAGVLFLALPALCWLILARVFNPPVNPTIESHLTELFDAGQYQDVINECESDESEPRYARSQPRILYIQWVAQRKLGNLADSDRTKDAFLEQFPNHTLAAEFHFADAMQLLVDQNYQAADKKLAAIETDFPTADVTRRCAETRKNLDRFLADAKKGAQKP